MKINNKDSIIILGATATGKTSLAVALAKELNGEIISADSRQVYKNLDIGTGKDLNEYENVPYHLIDICTLDEEYNVFNFQQDFYKLFPQIVNRNTFPIVAGGTGLYLDSIIRNYQLIPVPENTELRNKLEQKPIEELAKILLQLNPNLHNKTDLEIKERAIRAIELAEYKKANPNVENQNVINIEPYIFGIFFERSELRSRIKARLLARLNGGMIDEVNDLIKNGASIKRLLSLGLEYKYTTEYLQNKFANYDEYVQKLFQAIGQFAKRQETWFRRMERNGVNIIHINGGSASNMLEQVHQHLG